MPRKVECSKCGKRLLLPDEAVGKRVKCPLCGDVFTVPELPDDILELLNDDGDNDAPPAKKNVKKAAKKKPPRT